MNDAEDLPTRSILLTLDNLDAVAKVTGRSMEELREQYDIADACGSGVIVTLEPMQDMIERHLVGGEVHEHRVMDVTRQDAFISLVRCTIVGCERKRW